MAGGLEINLYNDIITVTIEIKRQGARMMDEAEVSQQISPEMERMVAQRAKDRASAARWDLDIAVFLFAILIIVIILLFYDYGIHSIVFYATNIPGKTSKKHHRNHHKNPIYTKNSVKHNGFFNINNLAPI